MGEGRWTRRTAESVSEAIREELGVKISASSVRRLLKELDYGLKSNKKCLSGGNASGRDEQFLNIAELRAQFIRDGNPIVSVDTKKKELVGQFKNPGRKWCAQSREVNDHDFRSQAIGIAVPYGVYDVTRNFGLLIVGESRDSPEFAVNCVARWWEDFGREQYPVAKELLLLADGGGSNSSRSRQWKRCLSEKMAEGFGLSVTVAHYPPGASKWNPIEHRMFSEISKNWAAEPLKTYDVIVNLAKGTKTKTGLLVEACRDSRGYRKGLKVTDEDMKRITMTRSETLPKWNYTIRPKSRTSPIAFPVLDEEQKMRAS